jgi:hypothetical protein
MQTHIVPVGFDYDRVIAPLVREQMDVDRVVLLEGDVGSEANVEYSRRLAEKLEQDFQSLLGAETERHTIPDVYDYLHRSSLRVRARLELPPDVAPHRKGVIPSRVTFRYGFVRQGRGTHLHDPDLYAL